MAEVLKVQLRKDKGKRRTRRLRKSGTIPAVLYGHGEDNICLALVADDVNALVRHGARVVDLQGEVTGQQAFLRELQWDPYGMEVLHVDLTRVSADEMVEIEVPLELRGEAPGVREGGVVEQVVHTLQIECPVAAIPEKLILNINELNLDESLTAADIKLPDGARLRGSGDAVIVACVLPAVEEEEMEVAAEGVEPEVIGRKAEEGEEEAEKD